MTQKIQPSKENCDRAIHIIVDEGYNPQTTLNQESYEFLRDFLHACRGRLPKEVTLEKFRNRSHKPKPKKRKEL